MAELCEPCRTFCSSPTLIKKLAAQLRFSDTKIQELDELDKPDEPDAHEIHKYITLGTVNQIISGSRRACRLCSFILCGPAKFQLSLTRQQESNDEVREMITTEGP